jgi:hypothetical protein
MSNRRAARDPSAPGPAIRRLAILFAILPAALRAEVDLRHYDLQVRVEHEHLTATFVLDAAVTGRTTRLDLQLAPALTIVSAERDGQELPYTRDGSAVSVPVEGAGDAPEATQRRP